MKFSTATVNSHNEIVPWLAATGELSYSPLTPPVKNYYFLYNFIFPEIFNRDVNLRQHYWFGDNAGKNDLHISKLLNFWELARNEKVFPIFIQNAPANLKDLQAPIAIFKMNCSIMHENYYLLMQHGSYLIIPENDQPLLESSGFVLLHRGIGSSNKFNISDMPKEVSVINVYRKILFNSFSNSVTSFNVAHALIRRTETSHLQDRQNIFSLTSFSSENIDNRLEPLLHTVGQCYTLKKDVAKYKFGPSHATFKTPVTNIRICSYFAGEFEVRILSQDNIIPVEARGCEFTCTEPTRI